MRLEFTKMHGCGNDYIYLDCLKGMIDNAPELARRLSPRRFSVGSDGLICIAPSQVADATMRMFNADGSESAMCGNGIRCVAQWLRTHDEACAGLDEMCIDTMSGPRTLRWQGPGQWQVEMGCYSTLAAGLPALHMGAGPLVGCTLAAAGRDWTVTCVSVGNPHCVTVVEDVDGLDLAAIGPAFERHENFPERINAEFVQKLDDTRIRMRVWERGSGETWACGTGACASVAALTEQGLVPAGQDIQVELRGGVLAIRVLPGRRLLMTGPAVTVCEGIAKL